MRAIVILLFLSTLGVAVGIAGDRFPSRTQGGVAATTGAEPARGYARPSRVRADLFIAGLPGEEQPRIDRVLPSFRRSKPLAVPDSIEVVFFARSRPIRVSVVMQVEGKSLTKQWKSHLRRLFDDFDRDHNGHLNRFEMEQIFSARGMIELLSGSYFYRTPIGAATWEELDLDRDGRVSFEEFTDYYEEAVAEVLQTRSASPISSNGDDKRLTNELFELLDQNQDRILSREEVGNAEQRLLTRDRNEDETLTIDELLRNSPVAATVPPPVPASATQPTPTSIPTQLQLFRGPIPDRLIPQLLKTYDKNGDSLLTLPEIGLSAELFRQLDADHNGKLTAAEMTNWLNIPPDARVKIDLGQSNETSRIEVMPANDRAGQTLPADMELRQLQPSRAILRVGSQFIDLMARVTPAPILNQRRKSQMEFTFPDNKTEVRDHELNGPQHQFLRIIFESADFDGNGKLTRAEFDRYMKMQQDTIDLTLLMTHAVRTPNLFQLLDENRDGRLSIRELRTAWDRLIVLEPNRSDAITHAALQPSAGLHLSRRAHQDADPFQSAIGQIPHTGPRPPLWFQKMDRNNDGDLSRSEFLGSAEDFRRLDLDHDGLISVEEALKATGKK